MRLIALIAVALLLIAETAQADDPLLNQVSPEEAVKRADTIFIGKIGKLDGGYTESDPITVSVQSVKIFRGETESQVVFVIGTNAQRMAGGITLEGKGSYIFFLSKENNSPNLFKILPATDTNVALVKKLTSN